MTYEFYKVLHLTGVFIVLMTLSAALVHAAGGGTKANLPMRGVIAGGHGVGLLLALVGGFGLLARLELAAAIPGWAWVKLVIWLVLGAALTVAFRKPQLAKRTYFLVILLAIAATYFARYKP